MALASSKWLTHRFAGGWATDFGPTTYGSPGQDGSMSIPYLRDARNVVYEFDGGIHKAPGTARLNSGALESGSPVRGVYDFWRQGTVDSPQQRRIIHVGDTIKYDQAD